MQILTKFCGLSSYKNPSVRIWLRRNNLQKVVNLNQLLNCSLHSFWVLIPEPGAALYIRE
jgi:hypothetical protein